MRKMEWVTEGIRANELLLVRMACVFNTLPVGRGGGCNDESAGFG